MEKKVDLPAEEKDADKLALLEFLLSPAACTEEPIDGKKEQKTITPLEPGEVTNVLKKYVEGVEEMYDRTGNLDLPQMFILTYTNGLPIYNQNVSVQQHTINALRFIFNELAFGTQTDGIKKKILQRLCDAFRACQAEQGRVIDAVYGMLTGRDKSFKDQVLMVVDVQKELVLENLVNKLNPNAWKQNDDIPQKQVPHITSSYRLAVGYELGLRGLGNAAMVRIKKILKIYLISKIRIIADLQ